MFFPGEVLRPPPLQFNFSAPTARNDNARQGLKLYGPFDSTVLGKDRITFVVIHSKSLRSAADAFVQALINGSGQFRGFQSLFKVRIELTRQIGIEAEAEEAIRDAVQELSTSPPDIVYFITSGRNERLYAAAKIELLGNGIPNQVVTAGVLSNEPQRGWVVENIALATYAKIGGTPWVVAPSGGRREVVIGISRAQDPAKKFVVGIVTLFNQDGDFLFSRFLAPKPIQWDLGAYVDGLSELIVDAYREYQSAHGNPETLVIHLCKRPGRFREVEAASRAVAQLSNPPPFALIHLNDDTNYRVFDSTNPTFIPEAGLKVDLESRASLLLLDGLVGGHRRARGVPTVLLVALDRRSTAPVEDFPRLTHQVFAFSRVNWRGFNSRASPATLNYSYLIARMIVEIGSDRWAHVIAQGRLRDKAWFL